MKYLNAITVAAGAALVLSGCASPQVRAERDKEASVQAWVTETAPQIKAGNIKRSDWLTQFYGRLSEPPVTAVDILYMQAANDLIPAAKAVEAGQITKDEFDQKKRASDIQIQTALSQMRGQAAAEQQQRNQAAAALLLQMRPVTTNCNRYGTAVSCTTY